MFDRPDMGAQTKPGNAVRSATCDRMRRSEERDLGGAPGNRQTEGVVLAPQFGFELIEDILRRGEAPQLQSGNRDLAYQTTRGKVPCPATRNSAPG